MQSLFKLLKQKYPNKQVVVNQDTTHWFINVGTEMFPVSKSELSKAENKKMDGALLIRILNLNQLNRVSLAGNETINQI